MNSVKVLLLISTIFPSQSEKYSLYYTHRAISKSLISEDIYEFYNSVKLNDIPLNFCNSVNKAELLTNLYEESKRLFKNESDELRYEREWLQINLSTLMRHMRNENRTNDTDLHVLQWRHGCAVEHHCNDSVIFLQGTDEYAYDGENLTFNLSMHWKPLVLEHNIIWNRESVSSLEKKCVETLTSFIELMLSLKVIKEYAEVSFMNGNPQWVEVCVIVLLGCLIGAPIICLSSHRLIKYFKHPEKQKTLKTPSQVKLLTLYKTQMVPELLKEIRPETRAGLAVALNAASDDENATDDSLEKVQTEELHETQSLCEAKETPAAAPTAARGAMGSKNISLPNFAMEREDTDQNYFTQNALQLPLIQHCIFRNISVPNLAPERKDTSDSS